MTCIYKIINLLNDHIYVGSAKNLNDRKRRHLKALRTGNHHSRYLQAAWNKYGETNFSFAVIEEVDMHLLIEREQFYIDNLKPQYNVCNIAGSSLGVKRTDDFKIKLRNANLGLKHPDSRNKTKSEKQGGKNHWAYGKNLDKETLKRKSDSMKEFYANGGKTKKGSKVSEEQKELLRKAAVKPILQLTLNNEFIKEWESVKLAAEGLNTYTYNIIPVLKGRKEAFKNYKFRYKMNSVPIIISIDFDETICVNKPFPNIIGMVKDAAYYLNKLYAEGYYMIISTCRTGGNQDQAERWLKEHDVSYHLINENHTALTEFYGNNSRKISADIYIDDKCLMGLPSWEEIYHLIHTKVVERPALSVVNKTLSEICQS